MSKITKEDFIGYIGAIQKVVEFSDKFNDVIHEYAEDGYVFFPDCTQPLIDLLEKVMDAGDDISYFCWELEFGKEWEPGMVEVDGKDVKLQTIEDLWEFINE